MKLKAVDKVVEIPCDQIKIIDDRYRKDMGDVESLAESIKTVGQLIPIMVTEDLILIAGERRLRAHNLIGKKTINGIIETRKDISNKIIEILENLERKDFTWQEQVLAIEDLHAMMKATKGADWSMRSTAKEIGASKSSVITDIDLAKALKEDPILFEKCITKKHAIKTLQRYKIDETMAEIALRRSKTDYGKSAMNHIFLGDCTALIDKLQDKLVNAVISDPFYGIDIDSTKKIKSDHKTSYIYDDSEDLYKKIMSTLIKKLPRVMAKDSWLVFFCAIQHYYWLYSTLEEVGFKPDIIPAIWCKSGTAGQTSQPEFMFSRTYETFIYARMGGACLIKQGLPNVLHYSVIHPSDKNHPVQKPIALMEDIIGRMCISGQVILDPFSGSGSTLVAALKKGCKPIGFELDPRYYNVALTNVSEALKMKDAGRLDLVRG